MTDYTPANLPDAHRQQRLLGGFVAVLGVLALLVPLSPELAPESRLGMLLLVTACIQLFHGFRRADAADQRGAWFSGGVSFALGVLLMNAPMLMGGALLLLAAGWLALDAIRFSVQSIRAWRAGKTAGRYLAAAIGHFVMILIIVLPTRYGTIWSVSIVLAVRIFHAAAGILRARVLEADDAGVRALRILGLDADPSLQTLCDRLVEEEQSRGYVDRYWRWTFLLTLFAIHVGRMGFDRTALGVIAPGFAVVGDLVVALGIGLFVVIPCRLAVRQLTRPLERIAWHWCLAGSQTNSIRAWPRRLVRVWLTHRLRFAIRLRQASYSLRAALARGLQIGLPAAAILAATTPVWGLSWYFDTENYAAGIWDSWAESRTDTWREAMIRAVESSKAAAGQPAPTFSVSPPGVTDTEDFSFLVIGDTGEGDASQHVLRDQLIMASLQPEVRFVVISSDVIYPSGAMRDYEAKFWLPFKGVHKPILAIPGNHDWYDALEGFAATFFEPDAARATMRARVKVDLKLTTTTDRDIEKLIAQSARLRGEFEVPTGFQQAPFFQVQTDRFALFAVDTGIHKRVDPAQFAWLKSALVSAHGKFKMAILGHPLYATAEYQAESNVEFKALHQLLREHDVHVVMAGDTHDLEYYVESPKNGPPMHHFVNGGGGAYLSMGMQFAHLDAMPTREWAFYPVAAPLLAKMESNNAFWKAPLWWWTTRLNAWPSSPEWLSAAFDYNVAPYFQSFFEVRVEPSANRVRLIPWGVHGRLRWREFQKSDGLRPAGESDETLVDWAFPLQ